MSYVSTFVFHSSRHVNVVLIAMENHITRGTPRHAGTVSNYYVLYEGTPIYFV